MMADFAIGATVLGVLSGLYFYPYVLLQIPLRALLDRLGPRLLLSSALFIAGGGSLIFGLADSLAAAYVGRILVGIGSAAGFLSSLSLAARWFSPSKFSLVAGLTMFCGMVSGMGAKHPWLLQLVALVGAPARSCSALLVFFLQPQSPYSCETHRSKQVRQSRIRWKAGPAYGRVSRRPYAPVASGSSPWWQPRCPGRCWLWADCGVRLI